MYGDVFLCLPGSLRGLPGEASDELHAVAEREHRDRYQLQLKGEIHMPATAKVQQMVKFQNDEERKAWIAFAAGAAQGVAGESDDFAADAREAAHLADAMLVQMRRRT
jgi:glutamate synthase domain-containing protein 1